MVPIEHTIPAPARYTLFHQGHGEMLDHMLITRNLLAHYRGSEIHNEVLHDESAADPRYPNPTTPPSSPPSTSEPVKFATETAPPGGGVVLPFWYATISPFLTRVMPHEGWSRHTALA